ncbi:MAG: DNA-processing protein DprA [Bacteroidales bacterium]|nr:DNA-processing protein DprA [Bacteroidales bacterium]
MATVNEDKAAWCALNTIFGFEPLAGHRIAEALGGPAAVFRLSPGERREILGPSRYLPQLTASALDEAAESLERLQADGFRFIGYGEADYPGLLRECEDPPLGLYLRSDTAPAQLFDDRPGIAVVGTRDISPYGTEWCQRIVMALSRAARPPRIVSGLALGTDGIAHRTALECGLPTLAVMATGIDRVYPFRHEALADAIAAAPGSGLVTDYPPGTAPLAIHFIRRNRIIAGLCGATLLVESKIRGGGLITARLAASYDRTVVALPGRIDDRRSAGCNRLIREQLAEPLTDLDDLAEQLGLGPGKPLGKRDLRQEVLDFYRSSAGEAQARQLSEMAGLIRQNRGIALEEVARRTGIPWPEVAAGAGILESDGFICMDLLGNCTIKPKNM